jgi:acyl carrier protein
MTQQEITPRIELVFARVFGRRVRFKNDMSRLQQPQWTSLKHVEFLIALEQEFGIRFDGADATDMVDIPVIVDRVQKKLS